MIANLRSKILFILSLLAVALPSADSQSRLKVHVENIKNAEGLMYIGLYNHEAHFRNTDSVFVSSIVPVDSTFLWLEFNEIPPGHYALTLFHDQNKNGRLDTNFLGVPKEQYGFSNNPKIRFKPPGFDKCVFEVKTDTDITVRLN